MVNRKGLWRSSAKYFPALFCVLRKGLNFALQITIFVTALPPPPPSENGSRQGPSTTTFLKHACRAYRTEMLPSQGRDRVQTKQRAATPSGAQVTAYARLVEQIPSSMAVRYAGRPQQRFRPSTNEVYHPHSRPRTAHTRALRYINSIPTFTLNPKLNMTLKTMPTPALHLRLHDTCDDAEGKAPCVQPSAIKSSRAWQHVLQGPTSARGQRLNVTLGPLGVVGLSMHGALLRVTLRCI